MSKENQKRFEKYYFLFRECIFWFVRKKVNNTELAEDLTSEIFMKLFNHENILEERDENGTKAWLFTVARNHIIDYYRKNSRTGTKIDIEDEFFEILSSDDIDYLDKEIKEEQGEIVVAAMEGLTVEEKEIIDLRFKQEMQFSEIAEVINKSEGSVKMTLYRALDKLKDKVKI